MTICGIPVVVDDRMPPDTFMLANRWPPRIGDDPVIALPNGHVARLSELRSARAGGDG